MRGALGRKVPANHPGVISRSEPHRRPKEAAAGGEKARRGHLRALWVQAWAPRARQALDRSALADRQHVAALSTGVNSWRGRPILHSGSPIISFSWAIQPTVRASAKMAVNSDTGMLMGVARCPSRSPRSGTACATRSSRLPARSFELLGQLEQRVVFQAQFLQHFVAGFLHQLWRGVVVLVHAVAKTHQLHAGVLVLDLLHELADLGHPPLRWMSSSMFRQVSLAPPWAGPTGRPRPQRWPRRVGAGRAAQAHGRCGCVLLVVSVQDEDAVQSAFEHRVDLVLSQGVANIMRMKLPA